jgi:hypothetical protein
VGHVATTICCTSIVSPLCCTDGAFSLIGGLTNNYLHSFAEPAAELGKRAAEMAMAKTPNDWKHHNGDLDSNIHGTTALIYMLGGEFAFAARDFEQARVHLGKAVQIFLRISGFECGSFLDACRKLQAALPAP